MLENVMTHIAHRVTEYYLVEAAFRKRTKKKSKKIIKLFSFIAKHFFIWLKTLMTANVSGGVGTCVRALYLRCILPIILQQLLLELNHPFSSAIISSLPGSCCPRMI